MSVKTFRDLLVWKKSHELVLEIYKATQAFPKEERFGLISQLRKSTSSIPTNIVEGQRRNSTKDFLHFLNIADSSLEETKHHLILSADLGYLSSKQVELLNNVCDEIGKMLHGLQKSLK